MDKKRRLGKQAPSHGQKRDRVKELDQGLGLPWGQVMLQLYSGESPAMALSSKLFPCFLHFLGFFLVVGGIKKALGKLRIGERSLQEQCLRFLCSAGTCTRLDTSQVLTISASWLGSGREGGETTAAVLSDAC